MAFHSEIKINYQVLQDIVDSFKGYETALNDMQDSIAKMDRVISENEGQTFDALGKIKHDFNDEIETCKEEVKDIYSSIESYISDMSGIIGATNIGKMLVVDRADILCNKGSIKDACDSIGPRMYQLGAAYRNVTINPSAYEHKPEEFAKIRIDTRRNEAMHEAINSAYETICKHYEKIDSIYKNKVVKFENKDDEHEESLKALHAKYTSWTEGWRELKECAWDFVRGVWDWGKDFVVGLWNLGKLLVSLSNDYEALKVFYMAKIIGAEPPQWSTDRVLKAQERIEALKRMTPWTVVESICQGASDSVAENGWAYGAGKIAPDVVLTIAGAKGLDKVAKVDDAGDATRAASTLDNIADISELEKFDDFSDISKAGKVDVDDVSKVAEAAKREAATSSDFNGVRIINKKYAGKTYNLSGDLGKQYPDGVKFSNEGFPEFEPYSIKQVVVNNLEGDTYYDFVKANEAAGYVSTPTGYTWHHVEDGKSMLLVPSDLHGAVRHTGGASLIKKGLRP